MDMHYLTCDRFHGQPHKKTRKFRRRFAIEPLARARRCTVARFALALGGRPGGLPFGTYPIIAGTT